MFSNTPPPAQNKTQQARAVVANSFETFAQQTFPAATPASVVVCTAFGSDVDEKSTATAILTAKPIFKGDSETLGEQGAIYYLQATLAKYKLDYDDTCLHIFQGANAFNMMYVAPSLANPQFVVVIEAKGGNSQLGWRTDPSTGARVKQGTTAYCEAEADVMAASKDQHRRDVANAAKQCMGKAPSKCVYIGVQTKYDTKKGQVYDPVPIFYEEI